MSSGSTSKVIGSYQTGDVFGPFVIVDKLGSGGSAEVYRARDDENDREVVLKIVPEDLAGKALRRFVAETRILSKLNHPNVIKIHEVGEHDGRHFYAMEYVEASTLERLIEQRCDEQTGFFSTEEVLSLFADMACALVYTHAQHIYHRDIKPANILVDKAFTATLVDFGVAKAEVVSVHTETGSLLGTPLYMSPEQLQGKEVDALSDLYSLGLVMYRMATGLLPFQSDNPYTSATRRLTEEVPPPSTTNPTIDPIVEKIVLKCLARDKRNRFQSAEKLLRALQSVPSFPRDRLRDDLVAMSSTVADGHTVEMTANQSTASQHRSREQAGGDGSSVRHVVILLLSLVLVFAVFFHSFVAPSPVEYVYGSLAIETKAHSATVSLQTTPALRCELLYGLPGSTPAVAIISPAYREVHSGQITSLQPASTYGYRLRFIGQEGRLVETTERFFTTRRHD